MSPFYDRAVIVKEGYALDGESVSIAMFVDGSVAAYWPDRADDAVRVLQGRLKERIVKVLQQSAPDEVHTPAPGIYLDW